MKKKKSFHQIRPIIPVLTIIQTLLLSWAVSAEEIRPLDWSKLKDGAGDDALAITCATVLEHTQKDIGKAWLDKIAETKQDIMAATYGLDADCSTKADHWAKRHGQDILDTLTGKPTHIQLESYHKGAFFRIALTAYLIRVLHVNGN